MKVLHAFDSVVGGGATVAAKSVIAAVGGEACPLPTGDRLAQAVRTVGGYCDPLYRGLLRDDLRRPRPDVVHLHNFKHVGTAAIAACKDLRIPVVWSCYDYWALDPRDTLYDLRPWHRYEPAKGRTPPWPLKLPLLGRRKRIMRWLNELDGVICLSRDSLMRLRLGGLQPQAGREHVIPLPVSVPPEVLRPAERDYDLVLYIGGQAVHKGWEVFQQARHLVQAQRPEIVCKAMFGVPRITALREIARAGALVVPEQWPNPGPVVIAEAQLLGTPVVASTLGGITEMAPTALAKHDDPQDFAEKILQVLARTRGLSPDISRTWAEERHKPAAVAAHLQLAYRQAMGELPPSQSEDAWI